MRWTAAQLVLPILIGVSLTGFSLGIIYLFIDREKDRDKKDRGITSTRHRSVVSQEIPISRELVPAVIGRGGSTIKNIENNTGTRIRFNEDNPDMPERICIVKGSMEGLRMAEAMLKNIISTQPLIETYETHIPHRVTPKLIGARGEIINRIQSISKAKIIIEKSWSQDQNAKRRAIIKGTAEQIASALTQIENVVHEYNETLEKLVISESSRSSRGKISPRIAAVNPRADNPLLTPFADDEAATGAMEVYVSAVENPSQFWVQVAGSGTLSLDELVAEMTNYYEDEENRKLHVLKNITIGQTVAAKFLFDGKWYRAEIVSILPNDECKVHFLDYGDRETVTVEYILELRTDFLSLRLQAIECSLANVKPSGGNDEWSIEAIERFSDLAWVAQWKALTAKVRGYKERALGIDDTRCKGSSIPCIDLFDKNDNRMDINIGMQLVIENLAEAENGVWPATGSTLSLTERGNERETKSPTPVNTPPKSSATNMNASTPLNFERTTKQSSVIEEIDLTTTPKKTIGPIQEVDLVTPVRKPTPRTNVADVADELATGNEHFGRNNGNTTNRAPVRMNIIPAGYESDMSDCSDEFTAV